MKFERRLTHTKLTYRVISGMSAGPRTRPVAPMVAPLELGDALASLGDDGEVVELLVDKAVDVVRL